MKLSVLIADLQAKLKHLGDCQVSVRGTTSESKIAAVSGVIGDSKARVVIELPVNIDCVRSLPVKRMKDV
jgi:hypothetical protein